MTNIETLWFIDYLFLAKANSVFAFFLNGLNTFLFMHSLLFLMLNQCRNLSSVDGTATKNEKHQDLSGI